ncbi:MAG: flippase-like domain-containing protein [Elusimicrobia bacterium]|nr:flippase-like domain-containing protein [Elusimicrobiota bacterium]
MRLARQDLKRWGTIFLGCLVTGGLTYAAFRNVRIGEIVAVFSSVRLRWIPVMSLVVLGDLYVRSVRWKLLLSSATPRVTLGTTLRLETIGLAVNNIAFLRLGEALRAYWAGRELRLPMTTCLATVFVERAMDMITLVFLFAAAAWSQPDLVPAGLSTTAFGVAGGLVCGLVFLAMIDGRARSHGLIARLLRNFPRLRFMVEEAAMGTRALRSWKMAAGIFLLGFGLWLLDALLFWAGGRAVGLVPDLGYGRSLLVLASAAAACFLPAVPGSFGAYEQTIKMLLVHMGTPDAAALGYAGFVHLLNYLIVTGLGLLLMYRMGLSLASLRAVRVDEIPGDAGTPVPVPQRKAAL